MRITRPNEAPSLQLRLLVGAAIWVTVALICAGIAIVMMVKGNLERAVEADLSAAVTRLIALAEFKPDGQVALTAPLPDPRYERPLSGMYWQIEDVLGGTKLRSRSLWDVALSVPLNSASEGLHVATGPSGQSLSALIREITSESANARILSYRFIVAEDRTLIERSLADFAGELFGALLILGMALIGAAWLQVRIGLGPLGALRQGVEAVRRGAARNLPGSYPAELLPLVSEVNDLLHTQEVSINFARRRAADLAHGLKTPLQVLGTLSDGIKARGDYETGAEIDALAGDMLARVNYQLRLSRLRMRPANHELSAELAPAVQRVLAVIRRTKHGESLNFSVDIPPRVSVDIDQSDLVELLGVLLENAARWSRSTVWISAIKVNNKIQLCIADDGPGLTAAELELREPPKKAPADEGEGTGLGLLIASEITEINGGKLELARPRQGGLSVTITLRAA